MSGFSNLVELIISDDVSGLGRWLSTKAATTGLPTVSEEFFEPRLPHWIYSGDTALHVAAGGHRAQIVEQICAVWPDAPNRTNRRGSLPIHYAADGDPSHPNWDGVRQVATLKFLFRAGSPLHTPDQNGATPLHRAVRTRCFTAVKLLLDEGANPLAPNHEGSTPFHLAVQNTGRGGTGSEPAKIAQRQIIRAFLDHGVSPLTRDGKGKSVLERTQGTALQELFGS